MRGAEAEGFSGCGKREEKEGGGKWEEESGDWRRRRRRRRKKRKRNLERERIFRGKRNEVEEKIKKANKWGVCVCEREREREKESEGMMKCQACLSLTAT